MLIDFLRKTSALLLAGATALAMTAAAAEIPADMQIIEAETFDTSNSTLWRVKPHFIGWYGGTPSGGKFLAGSGRKPGQKATKQVNLAASGKHFLHLRYMDVFHHRGDFTVLITQQGKTLARKEFDKVSLRSTPEGLKKYGRGFAKFVWQKMEFTANAGNITITLISGRSGGTSNGSRHIDTMFITQDAQYKPDIRDLMPIYFKVRLLPGKQQNYAMHIFIRRSASPYYTHMNITRRGRFFGALQGLRKKDFFVPGESSAWIRIDDQILLNNSYDSIKFTAMNSYTSNKVDYSEFELLFSRNKKDIIYRTTRKGEGNSIIIQICNVKNLFRNALEESRANLKRAENAPPVKGKPGTAFPFYVGNGVLSSTRNLPEIYQNELKVRKLLGNNGTLGRPAVYDPAVPHVRTGAGYSHTNFNDCPQQFNYKRMEAIFKDVFKNLEQYPDAILSFMDEPRFSMEHIVKCPYCVEKFADFLKANNAGITGKPTMDKTKAKLYYWTGRYRNFIASNAVAAGTKMAQKFRPDVRTSVNFGIETLSRGNMGFGGWDWFQVYNTGALTHGWYEDWANLTGNYQTNSFMYDQMRGACRKNNVQFTIYNILGGRSDWDIQAKGFNAIGHGNKGMAFFNYGPHYEISSDVNSQRPEIYNAIRTLTHTTGVIDKEIMASKVPRGEIAMLVSPTHDIWHSPGEHPDVAYSDNPFGKERIYLHLLLRHCGYRMDVLCEDDLFTELKNYKVLLITDSHLRKSAAAAVTAWVRKGGTLLLTANAMTRDEFDTPLAQVIPRQKFILKKTAGRGAYEMLRRKRPVIKINRTLPAYVGFQQPVNRSFTLGKGKVINMGFFPGISYHSSSSGKRIAAVASGNDGSSGVAVADGDGTTLIREYPENYRNYIKSLRLPVKPRISCNVYNVEANLLEAPDCYIIVLANFSGKPQKVTVTFDGKKYVKQIYAGAYIKINK